MLIDKKYNLLLSTSFIIAVAFNGCSENSEQSNNKNDTLLDVADSSKIEIVENKDAKAIKVEIKESDKSQSKSYYFDYNKQSSYDENSMPANKDASVRVRPRTNIEANANVRSPYEKVQISMLVKKLSKEFIVKCSSCHNDYANGIIGPSLLHKDYDYIYKKISAFKTGEKTNPLMNDLVEMMKDEEIKKLAREIFEFNNEIEKMRKNDAQ